MSPCESNFELKSACVSSFGAAKSAWLSNFGEKVSPCSAFTTPPSPIFTPKRPKLNTDNPTTAVLIFLFNLSLSFYCFISFCLNVVDKMKRIVKKFQIYYDIRIILCNIL